MQHQFKSHIYFSFIKCFLFYIIVKKTPWDAHQYDLRISFSFNPWIGKINVQILSYYCVCVRRLASIFHKKKNIWNFFLNLLWLLNLLPFFSFQYKDLLKYQRPDPFKYSYFPSFKRKYTLNWSKHSFTLFVGHKYFFSFNILLSKFLFGK